MQILRYRGMTVLAVLLGATVALAVGGAGTVAVGDSAAVGVDSPKGAHAANATVAPSSTARTVIPR
jgi:hypothetical protein